MEKISFKKRVKTIMVNEANNYKNNFANYEYLVCSDSFELKDYYIVSAKEDNYMHLTGVNSLISPQDFFNKCCDGSLQESDFNFNKRGESEKSIIGTVRRKINVLSDMVILFNNKNIMVEENFVKNNIYCSFVTADSKCTLGFTDATKSRPKSLLKGYQLDPSKAKRVKLLLRKKVNHDKFNEILIGDTKDLIDCYDKIKSLIDVQCIPNEDKKLEDVAYSSEDIQIKNINLFD